MILTIIFLVFVLGLAALSAFFARKYSWIVALIRTGIIAVSVVVAGLITKGLASALSNLLYKLLPDDFILLKFAESIPSSKGAVLALPGIIVAPFLFVALFLLLRQILGIVLSIVLKVLPFAKMGNKWISVGVGALNGILIAFIVLMPIAGFAMMGNHVNAIMNEPITTVESVEPEVPETPKDPNAKPSLLDTLMDGIKAIMNDPVLKADYCVIGAPLFDWMTSAKVTEPAEFTFVLDTEVCSVAKALHYGKPAIAARENGTFGEQDKENLVKAGDALMDSQLMRQVGSEAVSTMTSNWRNDEPYLGLTRPKSNEIFSPFLDKLYQLLSEENSGNIESDLSTMLNVLGDLYVSDVLNIKDPQAMMTRMGEADLLSKINGHLDANEHLQPLHSELNSLSMRAMSSALGMRPEDDAQFEILLTDISASLNDTKTLSAEERQQVVSATVKTSFEEYGVDVPADVANNASTQMIEELGQREEPVTNKEVEGYLVEFMVTESVDDATANA